MGTLHQPQASIDEVAGEAAREVASGRLGRPGRRALGVLCLVLTAAFLLDSVLVASLRPLPFDLPLERLVQSIPWGPEAAAMRFTNWLGSSPFQYVLAVALVLGLGLLDLRAGWLMAIGSIASLLDNLVKLVFQRERPSSALVHVLQPAQGYSYPSGHAVYFTWLAFMLAFSLAPKVARRLRPLLWAAAGYVPVTACLGRVWAGAHWPSDVLGGFLLATAWATFVLWLPERWLPHPTVRWFRRGRLSAGRRP
jgi:membrane-associated phospholipid phosphatase